MNIAIAVRPIPEFRPPTPLERIFNRAFGFVIGLGGGGDHRQLLEVAGRKTGKLHRTPVNRMDHGDRKWLVCPRGRAGWVKNAEAADMRVTLCHGRDRRDYALREVAVEKRPPLLRQYLSTYEAEVKGYFTVEPDAPLSEFAAIAEHHPVFELLELPGD